jgi:hypothetical protein
VCAVGCSVVLEGKASVEGGEDGKAAITFKLIAIREGHNVLVLGLLTSKWGNMAQWNVNKLRSNRN